eukprot:844160-Rhodomonas_salina.2
MAVEKLAEVEETRETETEGERRKAESMSAKAWTGRLWWGGGRRSRQGGFGRGGRRRRGRGCGRGAGRRRGEARGRRGCERRERLSCWRRGRGRARGRGWRGRRRRGGGGRQVAPVGRPYAISVPHSACCARVLCQYRTANKESTLLYLDGYAFHAP